MDFGSINWLAVVACVLASMMIGGIRLGEKTFFPIWWKAVGKADGQEPGSSMSMAMVWGLIVFAAFVQAVFMALMVNAMGSMFGGVTLGSGAMAGFFLWLGFVAPSSPDQQIVRRPLKNVGT